MKNYTIITDSGADISGAVLAEWGVKYCCLTFRFDEDDTEYLDNEMSTAEFYARMRSGSSGKTSAVNSETFKELFKTELDAGNDVLYLGFSSGLSATSNNGIIAANELSEEYPDRKIIAIDMLLASSGQGLMVYLAAKEKEKGSSIEETAQFVRDNMMTVASWFTVEKLDYLKRGGRISPTTALVGGLLNIKPVLRVDEEGHLVSMKTVRGRKASLIAIADKVKENIRDKDKYPIFISHADCLNDVGFISEKIRERVGQDVEIIVSEIGPVIGSHAGPGTVAVFYAADGRQ